MNTMERYNLEDYKVAIIIPAIKRKFLRKTLRSIFLQSIDNFHIYIGDDASQEDLQSIISDFPQDKITYRKFKTNLGSYDLISHWKRCIAMSNNEPWIWLFSDDDIMSSNCIEQFIALANKKKSDFYRFQTRKIDENDNIVFESLLPNVTNIDLFLNKKLSYKIESYAVECIFRRKMLDVFNQIPHTPLGWCFDDILWIKLLTYSFIYTIPNFQNPSGVTMSLEKRKAVYELAKKYGILILEDNPYGDLRYSGEFIPNIKSFDEDEIVIYCGSFSKVISPGMRVAYCIAPKQIFQKLVVCKQGSDVHTNIWSQYVCDEFITKYDFNAHLEKLRKLYTKKAQFCMDLLDKYASPAITYHKIDGGLFIWCDLPESIDMPSFCKEAVLKKVCVVPGNAFLTDENEKCNSFRINFSTPTDEQLEKGIKILGELANSKLK